MLKLFGKKSNDNQTKPIDDRLNLAVDDSIFKTGWTRQRAEAELLRVTETYGISYEEYVENNFCRCPKEKEEEKFNAIVEKRNKKREKEEREQKEIRERESLISIVAKESGCTYDEAENKMTGCEKRTGLSFENYFRLRFWEVEDETLYVTDKDAEAIKRKYNTNKSSLRFAENKELFVKCFRKYIKEESLSDVYDTVKVGTIYTNDEANGIETGKVHILYAISSKENGSTEDIIKLINEAATVIEGSYQWEIEITERGCFLAGIQNTIDIAAFQMAGNERKGMKHIIAPFLKEKQDIRRAEMPYGTKISDISKEGVEFYWKKPEFASGYEVFRAYEEFGEYEKVAVIEKRTIGQYRDSDFNRNAKEIFYRVRSFYIDDRNKTTYSELTSPQIAEFVPELQIERERTVLYSGASKRTKVVYGWGEVEDRIWTSSDENIAIVDNDGIITGVSAGECIVRCSSENLNRTVETKVIVDRKAPKPLGEYNRRFLFDKERSIWHNSTSDKKDNAVIMMVGDMMCSTKQMKAQFTEEQGYNFNDTYKYIRPVMEQSDFAIGNLETLCAAGWPYMEDEGWIDNTNNCNAPARYLDAMVYAGFDALAMSNNHNCDGGVKALIETIEKVDEYGFAQTGVFKDAGDNRYFVADVNGIKVGFVSYMSARTTFNGKDKSWTKEQKETHINIFTEDKASEDISLCRKAGAEFVIAYMHWGSKNYRNITQDQAEKAQQVADAGADFIVGSNPHLVQIFKTITSKEGRGVPCFFSIGNFVSMMNQVPGNRDSVIVKIRLGRNSEGTVVLEENGYIPCSCYNNVDGAYIPAVPLTKKYNTSSKKGKKFIERIKDAIGSEVSIAE